MTDNGTSSSRDHLKRLGVLIAVNAVDMLGFAMVLPILPFYAQHLGATPLMIGWIISSYSIAQLLSAPFWGRVSDRYGRRPALLIGLLGSAAAYIVFHRWLGTQLPAGELEHLLTTHLPIIFGRS